VLTADEASVDERGKYVRIVDINIHTGAFCISDHNIDLFILAQGEYLGYERGSNRVKGKVTKRDS
jgi:hypothetical protein